MTTGDQIDATPGNTAVPGTPARSARRRRGRLEVVPVVTLILFLGPIAGGLLGTWAPAFGVLPALGGTTPTLDPWRGLLAAPGLGKAVALSVGTGLVATLASFGIALWFCAAWHGTRTFAASRRLLAPLLALPHAAFAIGLAFLMAPSGWIVRALSPWATGWSFPPDLATVNDPWGVALVLGLMVKETPFLMLMMVATLGQTSADKALTIARTLGYGPVMAWIKVVLPLVHAQIRLPVYAVLAFSLSVVDVALILGPTAPPTLAVLVLRWFSDPDLALRYQAAAGACLQLILVAAVVAGWRLAEVVASRLSRGWLVSGRRGGAGLGARMASAGSMAAILAIAVGSSAGLALWSVASRWRFPDLVPGGWTLETWSRALPALAGPAWTTLTVGLASTGVALALVLGCLENEQRSGSRPSARGLWLLYLPLLVPQIGFLFGTQVLLVAAGLDGGWAALVWSHLLFVLPYVFLTLADPYRALDERYARSAACLGASPARVFLRVKLPLLLRPVLIAAAIGFSVSVAQYLPTQFAGAGRLPTLTTEAVGLAAGADRRLIGVYGFAQAALPLAGFALAALLPGLIAQARRVGRMGGRA
jgi:putative thiamine transport system permease protein